MMKTSTKSDDCFVRAMEREFVRACQLHGPRNSAHESEAVIREEFEEFVAEVRKKRVDRIKMNMLDELVQIAAAAWRAANDLGLLDYPSYTYPQNMLSADQQKHVPFYET